VAFGIRVTTEVVKKVEEAERIVRAAVPGLRDLRVRHLGGNARIETDPTMVAAVESALPGIKDRLVALGYSTVTVEGYRRGSLHARKAA
jgi:uncharacterized protein